MSVVLYALGAGLLAWSAYTLLTSGAFVTIDIAAGLAGYGVLAIGLGAVVGALGRLGGSIREAAEIGARAPRPFAPPPRRAPTGPVEPSAAAAPVPSAASPVISEAALEAVIAAAPASWEAPPAPVAPEPETRLAPGQRRAAAPAGQLTSESAPLRRPAEIVAPSEARSEDEAERPARKADADRVEARRLKRLKRERDESDKDQDGAGGDRVAAPAAVAPMLGGGFARARAAMSDGERDAPDEGPRLSALAPDEDTPPSAGQAALEDPTEEETAPPAPPAPEAEQVIAAEAEAPAPEPEPATPPSPETVRPTRPDPKIPEWLARARARREAKALGEEAASAPQARGGSAAVAEAPARPEPEREPIAAEPEPAFETPETVTPEPEPDVGTPEPVFDAPEPVAEAPEPEFAETAEEIAEPLAAPRLLREGEHNGVQYRFYDDGSIEAESPRGLRRFASVEDLRATIVAAGGRIEEEPADVAEAARGEAAADKAAADEHAAPEAPEIVVDAPDRAEDAGAAPDLRPRSADRLGGGDPFEDAIAELQGEEKDGRRGGEIRIDPQDRPVR